MTQGREIEDASQRDKPVVILAEDEMLIALTIQDMLEDEGFRVCAIAKTAESVVALAERHRPDVALVDVNLAGGSNGLDAVGPLSAGGIPSVVVSGHATRVEAEAVGARGMLSKPFRPHELVALVRYLVNERSRRVLPPAPYGLIAG